MNNLKIKLDDLDAGKLKTVPTDLKKLCYVVRKEVVKNIEFNTLNTTVNNSEKKKSRCDYFNSHKSIQYRKTKFGEKNGCVDKKYMAVVIW